MAKRSRNSAHEDHFEMLDEERAPAKKRSAPRRKSSALRWLVIRASVLLILVAIFVAALPTIITSTGLWKTGLAWAAPTLKDRLEVSSLSLGWLSPVVVKGIRLSDAEGNPLAEVDAVYTKHSLISLALQPSNPGKITVEKARARVILTNNGSNWEDFLAQAFPPEPEQPQSASSSTDVQLEMKDCSVEFVEASSNRAWLAGDLTGNVNWAGSVGKPRTVSVKGSVAELDADGKPAQTPGAMSADINWTASATGLGLGDLQTNLQSFPLEISQPILRRFLGMDLTPAGVLSADLAYSWKDDMASQQLQVKSISSPGISLTSPTYLAGDKIQTAIQGVQGEILLTGGDLKVDNFKLQSDLMTLSGEGMAKLSDLTAGAIEAVDGNSELFVSGEADVARVVAMLPQTLHLRPDTQITSGVLKLSLESTSQLGIRRLIGTIKAEQLAAIAAGKRVAWQDPISLTTVLSHSKDGPRIDDIRCDSNFLRIEGKGTLASGKINATGDLDKLAAELGQFIDFGSARMTGNVGAEISWQEEQGRVTGQIESKIQNFELSGIASKPWVEKQLVLSAGFVGPFENGTISRIENSALEIQAGSDKLDVRLLEPITLDGTNTTAPISFDLQGELANWVARAQTFVSLSQWQIGGVIDAKGTAHLALARTQLDDVKLNLSRFVMIGPGVAIQEQQVQIAASGVLDQNESSFVCPTATIACSSIAARADDVRVQWGQGSAGITGKMDYRANLARITGYLGDPSIPKTQRFSGELVGQVEAGVVDGVVKAQWTSDITNLASETLTTVANPIAQTSTAARANNRLAWQTAWVEPKVELGGQATYDPVKDSLKLEGASVAASALQVSAGGTIEKVMTRGEANLKGEIGYDLADVTTKLRPFLGNTFEMVGAETRQFAIRGPLYSLSTSVDPKQAGSAGFIPNDLAGELSVGWQGVRYVGLEAGAATLDAKLEKGVVNVTPFSLAMAEGKLNAAPQVFLNEAGMPLVLGQGVLIEQMRISPELCQTWMKYVAPLLADATRAEGKFSVDLQGAEIPAFNYMKANVEGKVQIHEAKIGPGPLASQYVSLAQQVKALMEKQPLDALTGGSTTSSTGDTSNVTWLQLPEQNIDVRVKDGRVYHQGMKMTIKDVVITTEGSVGLDQTVEMVATIPILDKWVEKDKYLASLKGQSIKIPVRGTLSGPRLDMGALQSFGKTMISTAAKGALEGQITKGLGKGQELIQGELSKGTNALQDSLKQGTDSIDSKLKQGEEKIQQELGKGLKKLFGG